MDKTELNIENIGAIIEIWLTMLREEKWNNSEREDVCKEILRRLQSY